MYARIVEGKVRKVFAHLSQGDIQPLVKGLTRDCRHHTGGTHALGGERHSRDATQQWYERLMRLMPGLAFDVDEVQVRGMPWNTTVVARWRDHATIGDYAYQNAGVNTMTLRFGKVSDLDVKCDDARLAEACAAAVAAGRPEGAMPPITDVAAPARRWARP